MKKILAVLFFIPSAVFGGTVDCTDGKCIVCEKKTCIKTGTDTLNGVTLTCNTGEWYDGTGCNCDLGVYMWQIDAGAFTLYELRGGMGLMSFHTYDCIWCQHAYDIILASPASGPVYASSYGCGTHNTIVTRDAECPSSHPVKISCNIPAKGDSNKGASKVTCTF